MVETPEKPTAAKQDTQYEFNLGLYRIETLSEILTVCAKKYRTAVMERDEESVLDYQAMVNTLYTETFIYMQDETEFEILEGVKADREDLLTHILDDFDSLNTEEEVMDRLQKVRTVYLEVRGLLQAVGIDIPKKEKIGETEAFYEGS